MRVLQNNRVPLKMWLTDIEESALEQAITLANLPYVFHHVAIMPDAHTGKGMPIGGVIATDGVYVPNAVGVDIGCGMCAVKTSLRAEDATPKSLKAVMRLIRERIPLGMDSRKEMMDESLMPQGFDIDSMDVVGPQYKAARKQLGTLGGGNHFIEIQKDEDGFVWMMIHSGSRNLGFRVAQHYADIASELCSRWYSSVPRGLEFLPICEKEAKDYFDQMTYCIRYAFCNRHFMMDIVSQSMAEVFPDITFENMINIAHNYAAWENHFGQNVVVHRKGATRARKDDIGIIPGSQGTPSYIVKGLGNPESFSSCSHGAGRAMSRTKAIDTLDLKAEIKKLDSLGIVHAVRTKTDLQEASSAYKDIDVVMANQKDLVKPIVKLVPLAVVKG